MAVAVRLENVAPSLIASVQRHTMFADVPRVLISGLDIVWAAVRKNALSFGHNVALYRPLGGNAVDLTCAVQVTTRFEPDGEVVCGEMPAGTAATATHMGPYARLGETHRAVASWVLNDGRRLAGINWEIYGDWDDDPAKLRTDVYMLLAPN